MQLFGGWNIGGLLSKPQIRQNNFPAKISGHMVCIYVIYSQLQTPGPWPRNRICSFIYVYHVINPQFRLLPNFRCTCDSRFTDQCSIFCPRSLYRPLCHSLHGISYCVVEVTSPFSKHKRYTWRNGPSLTLFSGEIKIWKKAGQSFSEDMAKQPEGGC